MLHLREEGYRNFNLGMAPLSGIRKRQAAPVAGPLRKRGLRSRRTLLQFQRSAGLQAEIQSALAAAPLSGGFRRGQSVRRADGRYAADRWRHQGSCREMMKRTTFLRGNACAYGGHGRRARL